MNTPGCPPADTYTVPISETMTAYVVHLIRTDAECWTHKRLRREEALAVADALYERLSPQTRAAVDRLGLSKRRVA